MALNFGILDKPGSFEGGAGARWRECLLSKGSRRHCTGMGRWGPFPDRSGGKDGIRRTIRIGRCQDRDLHAGADRILVSGSAITAMVSMEWRNRSNPRLIPRRGRVRGLGMAHGLP